MFKSGFVNIIGNPNVGKSTLTNALMNERISIINSKPQTTRHRILGIITGADHQIVISDSPGMIQDPAYELQRKMNDFAFGSFEDADILIFVTDIFEQQYSQKLQDALKTSTTTKFLVVNKKDLDHEDKAQSVVEEWQQKINFAKVFVVSAQDRQGIDEIHEAIIQYLPEGPQYYPEDQFTDKPERFFASEMIRNNILKNYKQEIPYSSEVRIDEFKQRESKSGQILGIKATIFVERATQKSIIIGKNGESIKKLGIASREDIESFFGEKVHLELFVTVKDNWRNSDAQLKNFGYTE